MKISRILSAYFIFLFFISMLPATSSAYIPSQSLFSDVSFVEAVQTQNFRIMNELLTKGDSDRSWRLSWEHHYNAGTGDNWQDNQRFHHTYLQDNYKDQSVGEMMVNNVWTNSTRSTYTYDANHNILVYWVENWENEAWVNYYRMTYTTEQGLYTQIVGEIWSEGSWSYSYRLLYTYDTDNNVDTITTQIYPGGTWASYSRAEYSYNTDNQISEIESFLYAGGWQLSSHTLYTYTAFQKIQSTLIQTWSDNTYHNNSRITYTYNGLEQNITMLTELYQNNAWIGNYLSTNAYDTNGNLSETIRQLWDGNNWNNEMKITNTYEQYGTPIADDTIQITGLSLSAYPNPFTGSTSISIRSDFSGNATLKIYNVKGQMLRSAQIRLTKDNTLEWQWNDVAVAGVYFVEIRMENRAVQICKLVRM